MMFRPLMFLAICFARFLVGHGASCARTGSHAVVTSVHPMEGGSMSCTYPVTGDGSTFPLLSFAHGDGVGDGGDEFDKKYHSMVEYIASSGFVLCSPLMCGSTSVIPYLFCRRKRHVHQLNAIAAAKALGRNGTLPMAAEGGAVGVFGHSTGGMTTLKCAAKDAVTQHGIQAALAYNGDGGSTIRFDGVDFQAIAQRLPIFLVTGSADTTEPKGSTVANHDLVLKAHPTQKILTAEIDGEAHIDPIDGVFPKTPLKAAPYVVAFFGLTLSAHEACADEYKNILGRQLHEASPGYYDNRIFAVEVGDLLV